MDHHARALAQLAVELQDAAGEQPTAQTVAERARDFLAGADWVSLTVRKRRSFLTLAATSEEARTADELQYALREGPCVDASEGAEWYRSGDVSSDPRWPRWGPRAAELGVGSLLSLRLLAEQKPFGALNMYSRSPGRFEDRAEVDMAIIYATHAAIAMTSTLKEEGLQVALQSRHQIGVAQGILMERYGLGLDASFALLVRYSSRLNMKVAELASDVITKGGLPPTRDH